MHIWKKKNELCMNRVKGMEY